MATIIFKPTDRCNSSCIYCDAIHRRSPATMSPEMLELVFVRVDEFLRARPDEHVILTWHGGEPLLLGPHYFEQAFAIQQRVCGSTRGRIEHIIQSNLTLFSEEFVEPFRKLGICHVGSSYDPEPSIRGARSGRDYEEYDRAFLRAIALLERYGLSWGIIYVVTRQSLRDPLSVFYALTNLALDGNISFNPVNITSPDRQWLDLSELDYGQFLAAIFREWWPRRTRFPSVEPFRSLLESVTTGHPDLVCSHSGRCAENHIGIGPAGELSQCGCSMDWGLLDYGNLRERSLVDVLADEVRRDLLRRDERLLAAECGTCRFWGICHGGCPADALLTTGSYNKCARWCHSMRYFLEEVFEPLTGLRFAQGHAPRAAVPANAGDDTL